MPSPRWKRRFRLDVTRATVDSHRCLLGVVFLVLM